MAKRESGVIRLSSEVAAIPKRIIVTYRYKTCLQEVPQANFMTITVYGTSNDGQGLHTLCDAVNLEQPIDTDHGQVGLTTETTKIIELNCSKAIYSFYYVINNIELGRVKAVDLVVSPKSHTAGVRATNESVYPYECLVVPGSELRIYHIEINDGLIFSYEKNIKVETLCYGSPTHYMTSRYSDFRDGVWKPYAELVYYSMYQAGINDMYFKVKNTIKETDAIHAQVSWHGINIVSCSENVNTTITKNITEVIGTNLTVPSLSTSTSDDVITTIVSYEITDDMSVAKV